MEYSNNQYVSQTTLGSKIKSQIFLMFHVDPCMYTAESFFVLMHMLGEMLDVHENI